jgi:hypothetical protein
LDKKIFFTNYEDKSNLIHKVQIPNKTNKYTFTPSKIQISKLQALNWSIFDLQKNQILTTVDNGIIYSLDPYSLKFKKIWMNPKNLKGRIEFSQMLLHKEFIIAFGNDIVILNNEKLFLRISGNSNTFRSFCLFSDESIAIGSYLNELRISKLSELVNGSIGELLTVPDGVDWVYNIANIENKFVGVLLKDKTYSLIELTTRNEVYSWKDSIFESDISTQK